MRNKNHRSKASKSISNSNISFNTGNLLFHPSGIETFKQQSRIIQEQRHRQNDIIMLKTSPHFVNRKRDSDEIQSEIENGSSDLKRFKEIKLYGWANGRKKETILFEYSVGVEYSQLTDDDSETQRQYGKCKSNRLNPEKSIAKNIGSKMKDLEQGMRTSQVSVKNKQNMSQFQDQNKKKSPFDQQNDSDYNDTFGNPEFLAYLDSLQHNKHKKHSERK